MDSYDYDIIIVGSGLYGAVTAWRAREKGLRCLVLERRSDVGGNVRDKMTEGINVHLYGAHIFHTDNEQVGLSCDGSPTSTVTCIQSLRAMPTDIITCLSAL